MAQLEASKSKIYWPFSAGLDIIGALIKCCFRVLKADSHASGHTNFAFFFVKSDKGLYMSA